MQIFISYRREDTAGRAGRLFDALVGRFGERDVFQDVAGIAPGADFDRAIDAAIHRSDVVLVIIGEDWATLSGPAGRRLDAHDDYVRREVAAALTSGVPVVPVLVGGATMPVAAQLPDDLAPLARRQAVIVRDDTWHQDIDALVRRLQHEGGDRPPAASLAGAARGAAWRRSRSSSSSLALWLGRGDGSGGPATARPRGRRHHTAARPERRWQEHHRRRRRLDHGRSGRRAPGVHRPVGRVRPPGGRLYLDVEVRNDGDRPAGAVLQRGALPHRAGRRPRAGPPRSASPSRAIRTSVRGSGRSGWSASTSTRIRAGRPLVLTLLSGEPQIPITS